MNAARGFGMSITSGIGLVSGIDTVSLIDQLLSLDAQAKIPIFQRIASLNASKTALLDVNARVLSLGNAARSFRSDDVFRSVLASSTNEGVATATATAKAIPGQYSFRVKQMVSTSQKMSQAFTSRTEVPLGLDQISFEWGNGRVTGEVPLDSLNGGRGVDRGSIRIQDQAGKEAVIDLSEATSLQEVIDKINSDPEVQVVASFDTDRIKIVDESGGTGALSIFNEGGDQTATDLGIEETVAGGLIYGTEINQLSSGSLLSSMNDGNGIFMRDAGLTDFELSVNGVDYKIDLGRQDSPITLDSMLEDLNDGDGIEINDDPDRSDFTIVTSTGEEIDIDLGVILDEDEEVDEEAVTTVGELLGRVNSKLVEELGADQVTFAINADGTGFQLVDAMGGGGEPEIVGAGPNGDETALDLGMLRTGSGGLISGSTIPNKVEIARASTIQDLIDRVDEQTDGVVTVSIAADGEGLDFSAGGDLVSISGGDIDGSSFADDVSTQTLRDLGFSETPDGEAAATLVGDRVSSGLGTVLLRSLQGGDGLAGSEITVTDRQGDSLTVGNLDQFETLEEVMVVIGSALNASAVDVTITVNEEGNGLLVADASGGTGDLSISGDAAASLGLDISPTASSQVRGESLQRQYVSLATPLSDLNYGRGIGTGKFRITNSDGESAAIDIGSDSRTVYDVIREINAIADGVEARLNDNGDGIMLVDTASGQSAIKVEVVSGTTARDLGILGEASAPGESIDGSYEKIVDLDLTDTLDDVAGKINDAGLQVSASILDTGTSDAPFRLVLSSGVSGLSGDLVVDTGTIDLGLGTLTAARNAKVFVGEGENAILVESDSNSIENVVAGVTIDLKSTSDAPVTINISRDEAGIIEAVQRFVDTFNDVIDRVNTYDSYDSETETRGPLLGDSTVSRVRNEMYRSLQQSAVGVDSGFRYLSEVGVRVGKDGKIEFNKEKFDKAYEADPSSVENLFTALEQQGSSTTEIADGVTIDKISTSYTELGFGEIFKQLTDRMTNSVDGFLTSADDQYQTLLDAQDDRIGRIDERIDAKRTRLQRQFVAMEESLARLQSQQSSLGSINQNIAIAGSLVG
ncbi:MAG: hypothetical protein CMJ23_13405 [Phycisphaerae bacterium]|nr:hypothetical protein [Phycisphaerae bacterium]